jgi:predicted transcriptional regulator
MSTAVLTLRINNKTKLMLDRLAIATHRTKSFLAAEAIERYIELEAWQVKEIKAALKEADKKDFVSDKDFAKLVRKHAA